MQINQANLSVPTPRQLEARGKINELTIEFIALLNRHNTELPAQVISKLRDMNNEIGYELNDLNNYQND
jgi:hypothetical protein